MYSLYIAQICMKGRGGEGGDDIEWVTKFSQSQ